MSWYKLENKTDSFEKYQKLDEKIKIIFSRYKNNSLNILKFSNNENIKNDSYIRIKTNNNKYLGANGDKLIIEDNSIQHYLN